MFVKHVLVHHNHCKLTPVLVAVTCIYTYIAIKTKLFQNTFVFRMRKIKKILLIQNFDKKNSLSDDERGSDVT